MKDIIHNVAMSLATKVGFYFGETSEINKVSENETSDVIVCLLPYSKTGEMLKPGTTKTDYELNILFLKRSDLDLDFDTREDSYLTPMEALADEFAHRLRDYVDVQIKPRTQSQINRYKQLIAKINEFDVNFDGTLLTINVPRSLNMGYCLVNYTFTISSSGDAVSNDFTWNHTISEVSSDGSTFGATANITGSGYTFGINAGSGTTGSYTFTPTINADYSKRHRVWVKWDNGRTSVFYFKVDYTYSA